MWFIRTEPGGIWQKTSADVANAVLDLMEDPELFDVMEGNAVAYVAPFSTVLIVTQ